MSLRGDVVVAKDAEGLEIDLQKKVPGMVLELEASRFSKQGVLFD